MYKYLLLSILLGVLLVQVKAQTLISGKITDAKGQALPYVNIGIKDGKTGTLSSIDGSFKLNIPNEDLQNQITFSCVGFESKTVAISELTTKNNQTVVLNEKVALLQEVKIVKGKRKTRKLGITGRTPMVSIPTSSLASTDIFEQARLIHLNTSAKILNANIFLISNDNREVSIRVNFYAFKNGKPAERIIEKSIIQKKVIQKGWLSIDLSKEDIYIDQDFVVSFEYLPDGGNKKKRLVFGAKLGASDSWLRSNSLGVWHKNELGGATIYVTAEL